MKNGENVVPEGQEIKMAQLSIGNNGSLRHLDFMTISTDTIRNANYDKTGLSPTYVQKHSVSRISEKAIVR